MQELGKRSKNFTEREKMLLIEVAKEYVAIIDNKKTDGTSVEAKKQAWMELTNRYNAVSESGLRTEKQLHALYDNLKKKARKHLSDDKSEMYKTGGGIFCPKTTTIDEKVVALLTPQFEPLSNEFDSSAPYYNNIQDIDTQAVASTSLSEEIVVVFDAKEDSSENQSPSKEIKSSKKPRSPTPKDFDTQKKIRLAETKKKNINNISTSIIKRKNLKQNNEDLITTKKLEILEIQKKQELLKLEKTKDLLDIEIELKKTLLESAKLDLELKKRNFSLV